MTEAALYEAAYNAHERAKAAALEALQASLAGVSTEALACLCDSSWNWQSRSWLSGTVIEFADEVLNERLESQLLLGSEVL